MCNPSDDADPSATHPQQLAPDLTPQCQAIIDRHYAQGTSMRDIFMRHSRQVTAKALAIAERCKLPLEREEIVTAAMLHDIGICLTDAPGIDCHGTAPYLTHGRIGADLLRSEGAPEYAARVAERHTGSGLTPDDANALGLPNDRSYMPQSLLEQLICYADKFFSKSGDMQEKPLPRVRASIAKFGDEAAARFEKMHAYFTNNC